MEYKKTLNMTKSGFPMRAGLPVREPDMLKQWSRVFNRKKKISFLGYLSALRLDYATQLVMEGDYDVKRLVEESGFHNERAFYKSLMEVEQGRCHLLKKKPWQTWSDGLCRMQNALMPMGKQ